MINFSILFAIFLVSSCTLKVKQIDVSSNAISIEGVPEGYSNKTELSLDYICPSCQRLEYKIGPASEVSCENSEGFVSLTSSNAIDFSNHQDGEQKLCLRGYKKNTPNQIFYNKEFVWIKDTIPPEIAFKLEESFFSSSLSETANLSITTNEGSRLPEDVFVEYCIGESPGNCNIQDWSLWQQNNSAMNSSSNKVISKSSLNTLLQSGKMYYTSVRLKDAAGNATAAINGGGWKATASPTFNQLCFEGGGTFGGFYGGAIRDVWEDSHNKISYYVGNFTKVGLCANQMALFELNGSLISQKLNTWDFVKGNIHTAISDGKGGWYIGGDFDIPSMPGISNLAHINADMTLDTSFIFKIIRFTVNDTASVEKLLIHDDYLYVGGYFGSVNSDVLNHVFRIHLGSKAIDPNWKSSMGTQELITDMKIANNTLFALAKDNYTSYDSKILKIPLSSNPTTTTLFNAGVGTTDSYDSFEIVNNKVILAGGYYNYGMGYNCSDPDGCLNHIKHLMAVDINTQSVTQFAPSTDILGGAVTTDIARADDSLYFIANKKLHKLNLTTLEFASDIVSGFEEVKTFDIQEEELVITGTKTSSDGLALQLTKVYDKQLRLLNDYSLTVGDGLIRLSRDKFLNYGIKSISNKTRSRFVAVDSETNDILPINIAFDKVVNKVIQIDDFLIFAGQFNKGQYATQTLDNLNGMLIYDLEKNIMEAVNFGTKNSFTVVNDVVNYGRMLFFGGNFKFTSNNNPAGTNLIYQNLLSYDLSSKKSKDRSFFTNGSSLGVKALLIQNDKLYLGGDFTQVRNNTTTGMSGSTGIAAYNLALASWPISDVMLSSTSTPKALTMIPYGTDVLVAGIKNSTQYYIARVQNTSGINPPNNMPIDSSLAITTTLSSGAQSNSFSIAIENDYLLFNGAFTSVNSVSRNKFAVYNMLNNTIVDPQPNWMTPFEGNSNFMRLIFKGTSLYATDLSASFNDIPLTGLGVFSYPDEDLKR